MRITPLEKLFAHDYLRAVASSKEVMMLALVGKAAGLKAAIGGKVAGPLKGGETLLHLGYLGAVYFETHGTHGLLAGGLAVVVVLVTVFGGEG